ncbi:unnamed protein product, partial [Pylaiella littoralis]
MTAAVEKLIPNTLHLYCIWHIFKNIAKKCASAFKDKTSRGDVMTSFKMAAFSATEEVIVLVNTRALTHFFIDQQLVCPMHIWNPSCLPPPPPPPAAFVPSYTSTVFYCVTSGA